MRGSLKNLYHVLYVEGPSGPRANIPGTLGVFAYGGNEQMGDMCLFKPDDPEALGGRVKLRLEHGATNIDGTTLRFMINGGNASYAWELVETVTDPEEEQAFLGFAIANDRIIRHLLDGARFYE